MDKEFKTHNYKKLSREYLLARKKFRDATDNDPLLSGNDNIVGRIGEFVAVQFLRGRLNRKNVKRNENPVEKGYDITADGKKVSVKTITAENTSGRTTHIKTPWNELILVEFGESSKVLRIGYITHEQFERFRASRGKGKEWFPVASRSMFGGDGLFSEKGKIFKGEDVKDYL